jgi:hypothetical protein
MITDPPFISWAPVIRATPLEHPLGRTCARHGRFLNGASLCPACIREEEGRRARAAVALAAEEAERAEMYGL